MFKFTQHNIKYTQISFGFSIVHVLSQIKGKIHKYNIGSYQYSLSFNIKSLIFICLLSVGLTVCRPEAPSAVESNTATPTSPLL